MNDIHTEFYTLEKILSDINGKTVVFVGVGNTLRGDDGVGCYIADKLLNKISLGNIKVIKIDNAIESCIYPIVNLKADIIIFIDAVHNLKNKKFVVLVPTQIKNFVFSTHNVSLDTIIELIQKFSQEKYKLSPEVYLLGIRIKNLRIAEQISQETKIIADEVVSKIANIFRKEKQIQCTNTV
ncbi:MAG: hydrogenase maturation protease [Endomicrobia bacterium]|nr:hydrogenase maturation protease [Endomicrobiia bacterium]MDW8056534.1 hydrogenase maturation protease [Elusimicrobiota bacterium]